MFITDIRSAKYAHLDPGESGAPAPVEVCWWLDEAGVQFRISGHAVLATALSEDRMLRAAVEDVWARLGSSTRRTFFWPSPGKPKAVSEQEYGQSEEALLDASHFALLLVVPDSVDELHLGANQSRFLYQCEPGHHSRDSLDSPPCASRALASTCDAKWSQQALNP